MAKPSLSTQATLHVGALVLGAVAVIAAAIGAGHSGSLQRSAAIATSATANQADAELERCRHLTPEHANDTACQRAWAEQRRRFLGRRP